MTRSRCLYWSNQMHTIKKYAFSVCRFNFFCLTCQEKFKEVFAISCIISQIYFTMINQLDKGMETYSETQNSIQKLLVVYGACIQSYMCPCLCFVAHYRLWTCFIVVLIFGISKPYTVFYFIFIYLFILTSFFHQMLKYSKKNVIISNKYCNVVIKTWQSKVLQ